MKYQILRIVDGQYTVKIDLHTCLDPSRIEISNNLQGGEYSRHEHD